MAGLNGSFGSGPIIVGPGQTGTLGYSSAGPGSGTLTFVPLGDGTSFSGGNTTFQINTTDAAGNPLTMSVPVSNMQPTDIPITYGAPGGLGAGEISVGEQPAFGAAGGAGIPQVPSVVPGSDAANTFVVDPANNAAQSSSILNQTRFMVYGKGNRNFSNKPVSCGPRCQAAKRSSTVAVPNTNYTPPGVSPSLSNPADPFAAGFRR